MLFADMELSADDTVPLARVLQPKAEAEVAVVLERDLDDAQATMSNLISAVAYVLPGIAVADFGTAMIAAVVLGLVNAIIRPILILLTLPATILTLGLFIFVINGLLFWMVGSWFEGFHVSGFWSGFFGAIVYSLISMAISALVMPRPAAPPEVR